MSTQFNSYRLSLWVLTRAIPQTVENIRKKAIDFVPKVQLYCPKGQVVPDLIWENQMELTESQALSRLSNPENLSARFASESPSPKPAIVHKPAIRNRYIPESVRSEAAARGISGKETQAEIAKDLGITQPEVSKLASGQLRSDVHVPEVLEGARDLALKRLMSTLGFMDEEKLSKATLKDLSAVAGSMSKVIDKTMPKEKEAAVTLIVYSPEIKGEAHYKVVEVDKS